MRMRVVQHRDRRRRARWRRGLWGGGEVLVTVGAVLMLLVVHQLWWTNREARQGAERKVAALEKEWGSGGSASSGSAPSASPPASVSPSVAAKAPGRARQRSYTPVPVLVSGTPRRSQAYAILTIPRLHLRVPVAEGVSKPDVLNKGYVGHYPGTQQPGQAGNFALAGHRNTHGEPFRYLPALRPEDILQVETKAATYTYAVDKILPQTSARDSGVVRPVPRSLVRPSYGYDQPGYYITLTTCTPEFTSRYRMVVWGKLVSLRPRPRGQPAGPR
ncbi:class E sortase [Streptomyces sp. NPDC058755]|uniref:class E sortase n=1 Tax=Streptomyces sp. NPDC058755 TaxID=3346624 RepID=UPI00367F3FCD